MLLWKRYVNNKMAAMRFLHLQQYSHRLNLLYVFFVRKSDLHLHFYLSADCELPNQSEPERQLVTLTTAVAVLHFKTIHNRTVNEKVKQTVTPFVCAPPNCMYLSRLWSKRSAPPIIALYSATGGEGKEQSMMCRLCSCVSSK